MLDNTVRAINNGQSRETGNIGYTRRRRKTKQKVQIKSVFIASPLSIQQ